MNASEGLLRLATVIRWTGRGLGAVVLILFLIIGSERKGEFLVFIGGGLVTAALIVGAAAALAWIIDGFAKPRE